MKFLTLLSIVSILIIIAVFTAPLIANTAVPESGSDSTSLEDAGDNQSPSVIPVQIGISGTITADILVDKLAPDAENTVFLGTSAGLYMISDGEIQDFIYTPVPVVDIALIDDCTGDGLREMVICLSTTCYPGIQCYDGASGDELWHFMPTHEAVAENAGWIDIQTPCVDIEPVADLNADNIEDVAVASGQSLYMVDGKTGKRLWTFEADKIIRLNDYVDNSLIQVTVAGDVNGDGVADLVSAGEGGLLYVINGKNGRLLRQIRLISTNQSFSNKTIGDIRCFQVDGRTKAAVSFNGSSTVCLVDLHDGSSGWESPLVTTSDSFEVRLSLEVMLSLTGDITGDSIADLLAYWKEPSTTGVSLLNGYNGKTVWSRALATQNDVPEVDLTVINNKQSVLVPLGRTGSVEGVAVLNLENGETRETLEINSAAAVVPDPAVAQCWVVGFDDSSFILASNDGDLMRVSSQGDRMWYLPRVSDMAMEEGQFDSDVASDFILYCDRALSARDGLDTEELWHYEVAYDDLLSLRGLRFVEVIRDINSDQYEDILACLDTDILVFDGNNGNILIDYSIDSQITDLDIITYEGGGVAFIAGTSTHIFVVTPEGELACSLPYSGLVTGAEPLENDFLVLDDINQDGTSELAITSGERIILVESSFTGSDLAFSSSATDLQPDGIESILSSEIVADIDRDGYREIYFRAIKDETYIYSIIVSPCSGDIILELDEKSGMLLDPGCADFDNDGYLDSLVFWSSEAQSMDPSVEFYGDGSIDITSSYSPSYSSPEKPRLVVISGIDQATLWEYQYNDYGYGSTASDGDSIPAAATNMDMDRDGNEEAYLLFPEVIRRRSLFYSTDVIEVIKVIDVLNKETVKEITVAKGSLPVNDYSAFTGTSSPGSPLKLLNDLDGDGTREIALLKQQYAESGNQWVQTSYEEIHPVIVNVAEEKVMSYFVLPCTELIELDDSGKMGMLSANGLFYLLDTVGDLQIEAPTEGASLTSPVEVRWQDSDPGYFNLIFIDNELYDTTHQSKTSLDVKTGSHEITVYSLDRYGHVSIQSIDIQVKSQPLHLVLAIVLIILALVALYSARIIRAVDYRHLRRGGE